MRFFKKKITITLVILIIALLCFVFHNDNLYGRIIKSERPFAVKMIQKTHDFAHFFNVKNKVEQLLYPLEGSDYIDFKISEKSLSKLKKNLDKKTKKKKWIKGELAIDGIYQPIKLKLHGTSESHFSGNKYSYGIKINKNHSYLNGMRKFKLIKGEEAYPPIAAINKLANSFGLISSYGKMKVLRINGEEKGDYYLNEGINKHFLKREYQITNYEILVNISDWTRKEAVSGSVHLSDNDLYPGHIEQKRGDNFPLALGQYDVLTQAVKTRDISKVKEMIDQNYMAKFLALAYLVNEVHFYVGDNLKLLYDFNSRKFYPLWRIESPGREVPPKYFNFSLLNKAMFNCLPPKHKYQKSVNSKLFKLLLSDDHIRNLRDVYLQDLYQKKDTIISEIKKVIDDNKKVILHNGRSNRAYNFMKKQQLKTLESTFSISQNYLSYCHVFGSYDSVNNNLNILYDAFVPIDIFYKNKELDTPNNVGISMDENLKITYNYLDFYLDAPHFKAKNLLLINSITKDTIPNKDIHINFIQKPVN
ncbi:MAG: hypothetical protein ACJA0Q_001368 [Saprospiraceae bacterium]|jgi:hypothetical protein